jgi:hypothetical protein
MVSVKHSKNPILYCSATKTDFSVSSGAFSISWGSVELFVDSTAQHYRTGRHNYLFAFPFIVDLFE